MAVFSTPDGKKFEADSATVRQLLEAWRLKKAIGATVGGEIVDCDKVFTEDTAFTPLFPDCEIKITLRPAQPSDKSLYRGKRCIVDKRISPQI